MFSVSTILEISKVCIPLTVQAIEAGIEKDLLLPRKIYCCYQSVSDYLTDDPTNADLPITSNYLFAICGGYYFEAERIIGQGGGGVVPVPSPGGGGLVPFPITHTITVGESGSMTLQNSDWIGLEDINWVTINQMGQFQYGAQFTFNSLTGTFNFSLAGYTLQTGDILTSFGFMPTN